MHSKLDALEVQLKNKRNRHCSREEECTGDQGMKEYRDGDRRTVRTIKIQEFLKNYFLTPWLSLMFFKIIGLATFTLNDNTLRKKYPNAFTYSILGTVYNVILIILMIGSNYFSIPYRYHMQYPNKTTLTTTMEILQTLLGTVVVCVILLTYCKDQHSFVKIANRLTQVEEELRRLQISFRRNRLFFPLILLCLFSGSLCVGLLVTEVFAFHTSPISWLSDAIPSFLTSWFVLQYFLVTRLIEADFSDVNRAIQSLANYHSDEVQNLWQARRLLVSNATAHKVLQLRNFHAHLCEISDEVSNVYSVPTLFAIALNFFAVIYNSYYLISPIVVQDNFLDYKALVNTILWIFISLLPVAFLTHRVTTIVNEVGKSGNIVNNLLSRTIDRQAKSELELFSHQLLHRKVQFTANGYFVLDNTLFHSILSATTTYLVILLQFHMGGSEVVAQCNCT